jgi:hypothetical protein
MEVKLNVLQHRANAAMEKISSARTSAEKHEARQEALAIKADLEKFLGDDKAIKAFKTAKPKNSAGVYKGDPVADHPVFMTAQPRTKITGPITLPDGSKAVPNPQYQITVPARFVPAMLARGFIRVNDAAITDLSGGLGMSDPARPNNT